MELYFLIAFYIIILLYSIILHEISHGVAALWLGDRTARDAGRLTLQPLPHMDPIGSVILPLLMVSTAGFAFGWAKPVPYNPLNLRWKTWGSFTVAVAGPLTNFAIATIATVLGAVMPVATEVKTQIIQAILAFDPSELVRLVVGDLGAIFFAIFAMMIFWNVLLGVFNLIPIPPLDGSKLLFTLLPVPIETQQFLERYGFFILIGLLLLTPLGTVFSNVLRMVWGVFYGVTL